MGLSRVFGILDIVEVHHFRIRVNIKPEQLLPFKKGFGVHHGLSLTNHDGYQDCCVANKDETVNSDVENLISLYVNGHFKSLKYDRWNVDEENLKHRALADQPIVTFLTRKSSHKLFFA